MLFPFRSLPICLALFLSAGLAFPQATPEETDAVRVNVTLNPDGSRTVYQFDQPHHTATATTSTREGKVLGKIHYQIDDAGRFVSGVILGPDEQFRFKSTYKYDAVGRLDQEIHLTKDDKVINKMVYNYDAAGRQTGYSVFDASGKLLGQTVPKPTASPKAGKSRR